MCLHFTSDEGTKEQKAAIFGGNDFFSLFLLSCPFSMLKMRHLKALHVLNSLVHTGACVCPRDDIHLEKISSIILHEDKRSLCTLLNCHQLTTG